VDAARGKRCAETVGSPRAGSAIEIAELADDASGCEFVALEYAVVARPVA
jgi:hypothetical protein